MTWVDAIVLLILAISGVLALMRGFVREALGLAAWGGAIWAAVAFFPAAQPHARHFIANPEVADPVAFGAVFVVALIVLSIFAGLVARGVRVSALGGLDRTLGLLFGVLRGAVLVAATYMIGALLFAVGQWPDAVLQARSLPFAYQGALWIAAELPPAYAPRLAPPPGVSVTDSGALLQTIPRGFARGEPRRQPDDQESR
jgi:membrane protein required for colicin V production